jgi:hypothetical protein
MLADDRINHLGDRGEVGVFLGVVAGGVALDRRISALAAAMRFVKRLAGVAASQRSCSRHQLFDGDRSQPGMPVAADAPFVLILAVGAELTIRAKAGDDGAIVGGKVVSAALFHLLCPIVWPIGLAGLNLCGAFAPPWD